MKFYKLLLTLALTTGLFTGSLYSDENDTDEDRIDHLDDLKERDLAALRDFLHSKRTLDLLDKITHLTFSGDVRTKWRYSSERLCGKQLLDHNFRDKEGIPFARNNFSVEFNFITEYETDRTWAVAHLVYDNAAGIDHVCCCCDGEDDNCVKTCPDLPKGIRKEFADCDDNCEFKGRKKHPRMHGSGTSSDLNLKRCYLGYQIYKDQCSEIDIEIGRRKMYDVFESDIQFNNRFDGIVLEGGTKFHNFAQVYLKAGVFVVDYRVNHYSWATEFGMLDILNRGLDFKYSLVDWEGNDRCHANSFKYINSQAILTYHLNKNWLCKPAAIYGAVLWNHAAKHQGGRSLGWYAGFMIGEVEKEGDWSLEVEYQWVGAEAVAWDDLNGIGLNDLLAIYCDGPGTTQGYKGWQIDSLYAITDNFTIDSTFQWAISNENIKHTYSQFEVQAVYAF